MESLPPRRIENGQPQQTVVLETSPNATFSLPTALQLAWSAVIGCYNGTNTARFDVLHVDTLATGANQALAGSAVAVKLSRNDSVQLALHKISQLKSQTEDEKSDTLLVLFPGTCAAASTPPSHRYAHSQYNLYLECNTGEKPVSLRAVYENSKWSPATVNFMLHQVRHAMQVMTVSLTVPVSALQGISAEGRQRLRDWDPAPLREPRLETVWSAIEHRCKQQPLQMAIESWDGQATYAELEQRVSAVAEKLSQLGLKPDSFIGLLLEKSMMSTIAILGVIKAGFAFVLLDASQPTQRLKAMCTITAVRMIIVSQKHIEKSSELGVSRHSTEDFAIVPSGDVEYICPQPSSPLYAGFTSGSTGEPKGFVIQHDNFMSGLDEYCNEVSLKDSSRVFLFASFSFVVSITGQLAPLSRGACLCIPSQLQLENHLAGTIQSLKANWVATTPSAARVLVSADVTSLETMVMVGEEMTSSDLAKWSHLNLYSLYGQSENSKGTMVARKTEGVTASSIGRPYHANAWIVDQEDHNVLVPIGAEGELVVESPCLTKGYINNRSQNEISFVKNPEWSDGFGRQGDVCIFKTGDLVRRNASDGSFQLLGRKGTRIKIRGQRVELGEVEYHIRRLLPVARNVAVDIVCTAEDALQQSPMLVAFILMSTELGIDKSAPLLAAPRPVFQKQSLMLDAELKNALPSFMVPTAYVELATMPKTSTGKLDRRRMREAAATLSRRELIGYSTMRAAYREARSEEEIVIRDLCEHILQLPRGEVGMNDTFLDLGGDSLMARHFITGARLSGLSITLQVLFQPVTLAHIARSAGARKECEIPYEPSGPDGFTELKEEFISDLPESLCEGEIVDAFPTLETQAAYASSRVVDCFPLHISGSVDVERLRRACQMVTDRHAILRTVFHCFRGSLVQVVLRELDLPFVEQKCDGWDAAVHWVKEFGSQELKKRYDIGKPIVGFVLVSVTLEARHILVMRLCHGQYDALCLRPLIQDLWSAYQDVPLSAKTEFKKHAQDCFRQRKSQAYDVWHGVLQGSQPPSLFPRLEVVDDIATLSLTTRQLPTIRPLAGATAASMVKAAWFEALWHETGHNDITFGQFLHAWSGNEGVVGPCMNVIPVRVRQLQGQTRRQTLQRIQAQHAETAPADALGWSDIVSNCTDWPAATEVDSVVLHQNFDRHIEIVSDGIICRKETPILSQWAVFPMLLVTHPRESRLDALLLMSSRYRGLRDPASMLCRFARALELLQSHPDETLESEGL